MKVMSKKIVFTKLLIFVFFLISVVVFALGKDAIQFDRMGDAAIFEQVIESAHAGKGGYSAVFAATQNFIDRGYASISYSRLLQEQLIPAPVSPRDMMHFHAYWLMFLISPLLYFFSSSLLLVTVQTVAYGGFVLMSGLLVFRQTQRAIPAVIFGTAVLVSPVVLGGVLGQFYPDRLFLVLGFILCWVVYFGHHSLKVVAVSVFVALLNERAALIGGFVLVIMPLFSTESRLDSRQKHLFIGLGVMLLAYAWLVRKLWINNFYYQHFLPDSFESIKVLLGYPGYVENGITFLVVNAIFLGLACINWRWVILPIIVMAPNLLGNIGGAEKTGWLTHYHSYYFPIVVFFAGIGFSRLIEKREKIWQIFLAGLVFVGIFLISRWQIGVGHLPGPSFLVQPIQMFRSRIEGAPTGYEIRKEAIAMVPAGSFVLAEEGGIALLVNHVRLDRFPVNIDRADYLFLGCNLLAEQPNGSSAPAIGSLVREKGFSTVPLKQLPALGLCLYGRQSSPVSTETVLVK
ncbi:hypothetical protein HNQ50_000328 [Silvimonas terrae]|uniref:Glycosyltransferase RgtA/B/C/D-like domain-containing protein n=1 Tax=Silvimonas terrae TaxID=300266 RepID=A0A840RAQ5_9NEIS|nr:DUF2079 domain-containing protein [Silvimonas terrae]MBB5189618.1 hypothetical protein [Silvimonas terrae]